MVVHMTWSYVYESGDSGFTVKRKFKSFKLFYKDSLTLISVSLEFQIPFHAKQVYMTNEIKPCVQVYSSNCVSQKYKVTTLKSWFPFHESSHLYTGRAPTRSRGAKNWRVVLEDCEFPDQTV